MKKIIVLLSLFFFLVGCGKMKRIYIYNPDKSQCITVFSNDEIRYIVDGKNKDTPDTNYIKLDISSIPPLGDALYICWKGDSSWDMVIPKSKIIECKIDTAKFKFNSALPVDNRGIPTPKKYRGDGCATFDFYTMKLIPNRGAIIEY